MPNSARQGRLIVLVVAEPGGVSEAVELIRRWGHIVHQFRDGPEAVMEARSIRPNIMLVDLSLPDISPVNVMERVGNCRELSRMRLVAVIPQDTSTSITDLKKYGFADVLFKPVDPLDLLSLLVKARSR